MKDTIQVEIYLRAQSVNLDKPAPTTWKNCWVAGQTKD